MRNIISIFSDQKCEYNSKAPYNPIRDYAEYPFSEKNIERNFKGTTDGYDAVRRLFVLMKLDEPNFGNTKWNPLGEIVRPGQNVVIKPNFVLHTNEGGEDIYAVLTHPSILRAIADYCIIALKGEGTLSIIEAPQMDCQFEQIERLMFLKSIQEFYKINAGIDFQIIDIRKIKCEYDYKKNTFPAESFKYDEYADPRGYQIVDLGKNSLLDGLVNLQNLYGADFDRRFTVENHTKGVHKYCISKSILDADTIICVPKMKTHKKVGVTLNIKLLVGINGDKNYLAHYRVGSISEGGDEFPDPTSREEKISRKISRNIQDHLLVRRSRLFDIAWLLLRKITKLIIYFPEYFGLTSFNSKKLLAGGNWYGNDTAWRMALDLAKIALYCDKNGKLSNIKQRNLFSVVDGITAGEGDGPMAAMPKRIGILIGGGDILAVDTAACTLMGFDYKKVPMLRESWNLSKHRIAQNNFENIMVASNDPTLDGRRIDEVFKYKFLPHRNWKGHIEY